MKILSRKNQDERFLPQCLNTAEEKQKIKGFHQTTHFEKRSLISWQVFFTCIIQSQLLNRSLRKIP